MVIKLNQKPIVVRDEDNEEKDFSPVYLAISCVGYAMVFWILDYSCFVFFGIHPFPFFSFFTKLFSFLAL